MRIRGMGWMMTAVAAGLAITGLLLLISGVAAYRLVGARVTYELNSRIRESVVTISTGALCATDLDAGSGEVKADGVRDGLVINAGFGDIEAIDIQAAGITLNSRSGAVHAQDLEAQGDVRLESGFGDITLERSAARRLSVEAGSGNIRLADLAFEGALEALSAFGDIEIIGVREAQPVVKANSGSILFSGRLAPKVDALFETDFGDVELRLPESSAIDVDLESSFGRVTSELPVLAGGELGGSNGTSRISGRLGEGGSQLRAHSRSGSVRILALEDEE